MAGFGFAMDVVFAAKGVYNIKNCRSCFLRYVVNLATVTLSLIAEKRVLL